MLNCNLYKSRKEIKRFYKCSASRLLNKVGSGLYLKAVDFFWSDLIYYKVNLDRAR